MQIIFRATTGPTNERKIGFTLSPVQKGGVALRNIVLYYRKGSTRKMTLVASHIYKIV